MPKAERCGVCPGCSRHCPVNSPRCKYGQKYLARCSCPSKPCCSKKKAKWEKFVEKDSLLWKLFSTSRSLKKALRKSRITENEITARLSEADRKSLLRILDQISLDKD